MIAHHPMQSISFASGGDTVSWAFSAPSSFMLLLDILADCTLDVTEFIAGFQSHDWGTNEDVNSVIRV